MMMWKDPGVTADSFYEARSDIPEGPKSRFKIKSGKTLSARKWKAAFNQDGHLDMPSVLSRIQRGGVHPSIRGEVWEFLLGCFDPQSSHDERKQLRQQRRDQYEKLKELCANLDSHVGSGVVITSPLISEDGKPIQDPLALMQGGSVQNPPRGGAGVKNANVILDKAVINWMHTLPQIGLDVLRTDRTLVFYEDDKNLSKLWDILAIYAWMDKDVGYCQGMSDLCSPMLILLGNEADAFWCFERLMRKLRGNFRCTERSVGVEDQLHNLASITQLLDPKLHQHLEDLGGGDYLFAVRMFMVLFRRELTFADSLYLWEMMWGLEYHPDMFSLYEEPESHDNSDATKKKSIRQCGKYERDNIRNGGSQSETQAPLPITVFLVASVLKEKSARLLREARGLDDVVQILNDMDDLDAKKACSHAIKLHKKYLKLAKS